MSIDDSDFDRLVAGDLPADDAAWSGVAAFLADLRSVRPSGPTAGIEAEHLAAVARECRVVAAADEPAGANVLSMRRTRFRRVLVSSLAGATVLLTAGVGAAAAMGINPIAQLVAPRIDQHATVAPAPVPPSDGSPSASDAGRRGNHTPAPPVSVPTPTSTGGSVEPTTGESAKPTKVEKTKKAKAPKKEKKEKSDKSNNGKSDHAKDKSGKTNNGKQKTTSP